MPSESKRWKYVSYYRGRDQAREAIIKQIYVKYYRRKLAAGDFRFNWVPDTEKLKELYDQGNEKADDDRCMLITVSPGVKGDGPYRYDEVQQYLLAVTERLRGYKNFLDEDAEFCLEHRGSDVVITGCHAHIAHGNIHGISKSDFLRRTKAACELVAKDYAYVTFTPQSVDIRLRPRKSAFGYIKKNREYDLVWGYGYIGLVSGNFNLYYRQITEKQAERCAYLQGKERYLETRLGFRESRGLTDPFVGQLDPASSDEEQIEESQYEEYAQTEKVVLDLCSEADDEEEAQ